jgi:cytochrome oxidase Cu insertion factor (SCO1/SenC/PrrC family)
MNRLPLGHEETRSIPSSLSPYLASPPVPISTLDLNVNGMPTGTAYFQDKWTFVYFSHLGCLPSCQPSLSSLVKLKNAYANPDIQVVVVGIEEKETAEQLLTFLESQGLSIPVITGSQSVIDQLAKDMIALFLKTDYADGSYLIEQEHHLFLVDPKSRLYATFKQSGSASHIINLFPKIRLFYAKTE